MANFDDAIVVVMANGEPTNFGITQKYLQQAGRPCEDMQKYTKEEAIEEYKSMWNQHHYNLIDSDDLATSVFSASVNIGEKKSITLLQQAYNFVASRGSKKIIVDGILGVQTLSAINSIKEKSALLSQFRNDRAQFYQGLFLKSPARNK